MSLGSDWQHLPWHLHPGLHGCEGGGCEGGVWGRQTGWETREEEHFRMFITFFIVFGRGSLASLRFASALLSSIRVGILHITNSGILPNVGWVMTLHIAWKNLYYPWSVGMKAVSRSGSFGLILTTSCPRARFITCSALGLFKQLLRSSLGEGKDQMEA